jgi:osmoprotectant transport system ATP-binding protein
MDEPFSAVDPLVRADLQKELLRLQAELGKTILFVTHDIDEAVALGDRIAVFQRGGRLAQVASPETLLTAPATPFVNDFLGGDKGVKWLSFLDTAAIPLHPEDVVDAATWAGQPASDSWRLVVDDSRHALGWAPPGTTDRAALQACRRAFRPDVDPMRAALDSALLSPGGLAVAVDPEDRVLGVASHADIAAAIRAKRGTDGL